MRLVSLFAIAMLGGCSDHYSAADVAGKYVISVKGGGVDTIELSPDGTYTHSYKTEGGNVDHQGGTWGLEALQAGPTVVLNNFRPLLGEDIRGEGTYLLLVQSSFGRITLVTNIDLGDGYKRAP
jgi:hypothetical protein